MLFTGVHVIEVSVATLLTMLPYVMRISFAHRRQGIYHASEVSKIERKTGVGSPMGKAFGGVPASGVSKPGTATSIRDLSYTDEERLGY
jgi:hypothetical protein